MRVPGRGSNPGRRVSGLGGISEKDVRGGSQTVRGRGRGGDGPGRGFGEGGGRGRRAPGRGGGARGGEVPGWGERRECPGRRGPEAEAGRGGRECRRPERQRDRWEEVVGERRRREVRAAPVRPRAGADLRRGRQGARKRGVPGVEGRRTPLWSPAPSPVPSPSTGPAHSVPPRFGRLRPGPPLPGVTAPSGPDPPGPPDHRWVEGPGETSRVQCRLGLPRGTRSAVTRPNGGPTTSLLLEAGGLPTESRVAGLPFVSHLPGPEVPRPRTVRTFGRGPRQVKDRSGTSSLGVKGVPESPPSGGSSGPEV